jgi:alkylation response protein AidB-like acyl-CoA dehydrogenase
MQLELRAAFVLAFRVVELLGKDECGDATESESQLLRFLIPVAKLYTAKQAIAVASEALEAFGGAGYLEDAGLPRLLRDAQVLSIWEGTTNILSLDALRAMERSDVLDLWASDVKRRISGVKLAELSSSTEQTLRAVQRIAQYAARAESAGAGFQQAGARGFAFAIARTEAATLLVEQANAQKDDAAVTSARRWCARELAPLVEADAEHRAGSVALEHPAN